MFVVVLFQLGWRYGTTTEDLLTGLRIHEKGWRSVYHILNPSAFLWCAPSGGPATMNQQKRWATSMLEILLSKNCPIFATLFGKLQLRQGFAYLWLFSWGLQPIPELCYAALPVYSIITNSHLLPKVMTNYNHPNLPRS
jgi:cellulose synthase/poly-beta-1,6-N-acetylglucosamine synthase-like glycosyltransferase